MSLNWKEIDLILHELDLEGAQIQGVVQSAFDVMVLRLHKKGKTINLLISIGSGECRLHETFKPFPKSDKPLRFAQFINSRIVNGYIIKAKQISDNRIVEIIVKRGEFIYNLYLRLWSNAANFIVTDTEGGILDAMRRQPKRGEITGGFYSPDDYLEETQKTDKPKREYFLRDIPGEESFNKKIDNYYAEQGGSLSLETLKEQVKRIFEGSIDKISAALDRLREKAGLFDDAEKLKNYGDLILSNIAFIKPGDKFLETELDGRKISIDLRMEQEGIAIPPAKIAAMYYDQYRKAKNGQDALYREIAAGEKELKEVTEKLEKLLAEENPLVLAKLISRGNTAKPPVSILKKEKNRPGLTFIRGDWQIIVGRDASENDELLRRFVRGNDLWLHARDYHGSYVFIKQRAGKTVPLDILLDAGNLAIFYSKGRNNAKGDLFYTQVKYLRRAKDAPKGLVIPTQEKNLHVKLDEERLRALEKARI
ncbi:MAG: NFACT RNA binding domain-containing protein [Treponema sp.]|jgi:predicted ribosome quality control (RQC) complex YloA/Tae2 family protein|nr:NFACT RNA binding domain-containing protein [Treponema sp.]